MPKSANIVIGETYGYRTVVEVAPSYHLPNGKFGYKRWVCRCVHCALEQRLPAWEILKPQGEVCRRCRNRGRRKVDAAFRKVVSYYRGNARKRGIRWVLLDDEVQALFAAACHYCGSEPTNFTMPSTTPASDPQPEERGLHYSGLDRVDNLKGYEPGNVVPCCRTCNWAKGDKSYADFIAWLERLVAFRSAGVSARHEDPDPTRPPVAERAA